MENWDSFEEEEATNVAVSQKYKKYEAFSKGSLSESFRRNLINLSCLQKV